MESEVHPDDHDQHQPALGSGSVPEERLDLPDTAARLLRGLADLPLAEIGGEAAAALLNTDTSDAADAASALVERSLAIQRGDRIALHAVVRAFARP